MEHLAHIGKMSAVLAHEIRNPLGTIKGFVQLAAESGEERTRNFLAPALAEVHRPEALVKGLLAYGRPPVPHLKAVSWNEVARQLRAHTQLLPEARVAITIEEAGIELHTDPAVLGQALLNLLRNAVESIPPGAAGEVQIGITCDNAYARIAVTDNGAGISDEGLTRLFEPFFTTKASGTGLGLAITRLLVESLGGSLVVRRRDEGGTLVVVQLASKRPHSARSLVDTHGIHSHS